MGRTLKRVPLDFDWERGVVWAGYTLGLCLEMELFYKEKSCEYCKKFAKLMKLPIKGDCPRLPFDPPEGEGYQLWETTSEGSPSSPVFKTLDELCEWCAENATTFASNKATKEQWRKMLSEE